MVSDGEPPPLPDTDDPYELLGVTRDTEPAAVKKAYARLVRAYRPDRAPREFQRVREAFELVRAHEDGTVTRHAEPTAPAPPTIDEEARARGIAARVAAAESLPARCALIDELLAERAPLDLAFSHPELRDAALRHRTLTWSRLAAASSDLDAVLAIWGHTWRYAFEHDQPRAAALLDDDRLRRDAGDHPHVAKICLDFIAALNWMHSFDERRLVRMLRDACPSHPWLDHAFDAIGLEFAGASAIRMRDWPPPIHAFVKLVIAARIDDATRCTELARELRATLAADLDATWMTFEALGSDLALNAFYEILHEALSVEYVRLDALPKERFDRLTAALTTAGASPLTWKIRGGVVAGSAALAAISWLPGALLLGGAITYGLATETLRYRREIRPRLARALLEEPVSSTVVHRWVLLNRKLAGRLVRYTPGIDNDVPLYTFSLLVSYAHTFM